MSKNMTALISAFVRMYHAENSTIKIYNDEHVKKIITVKEYNEIKTNLEQGISYFNPNYKGTTPISWIVNNHLAPTVLAREIINEKYLLTELKLGLKQYLILASGYSMSAFKFNSKLKIFELDKKDVINDKLQRLNNSNLDPKNITYIKTDFTNLWLNDLLKTTYNPTEKTFCSLMGLSYYLDKETFNQLIKTLSKILSKGSLIFFDYPNPHETNKENIIKQLAKASSEEMQSIYTLKDIETLAQDSNFLIYEHLNHHDIDNTYFYNYNTLNPDNKITAFKGISYVLFVKQ